MEYCEAAQSGAAGQNDTEVHWYALWVYRSLAAPILALCEQRGAETYRPLHMAEHYTETGVVYREEFLLPNLLFIRTTLTNLCGIQRLSGNRGRAYCYPGTREPAPISDQDMMFFMLVTKRGGGNIEQVDFPIDKGDRVRVIGGMFCGAEGYIRRVHGSRRFVVAIEGVVAVAVTHIPREYLERVGTCGSNAAAM